MRKHLFRFIGYEIPNQVRNDGVDGCGGNCFGLSVMRFRNEFRIAIIEKPLKTNVIAIVWVYRINAGDSESSSELL